MASTDQSAAHEHQHDDTAGDSLSHAALKGALAAHVGFGLATAAAYKALS